MTPCGNARRYLPFEPYIVHARWRQRRSQSQWGQEEASVYRQGPRVAGLHRRMGQVSLDIAALKCLSASQRPFVAVPHAARPAAYR